MPVAKARLFLDSHDEKLISDKREIMIIKMRQCQNVSVKRKTIVVRQGIQNFEAKIRQAI